MPKGHILLRCPHEVDKPEQMLEIFNNRNKRIAKVIKIFGPVRSPYLKARPMGKQSNLIGMIGKDVFLKSRSKKMPIQ